MSKPFRELLTQVIQLFVYKVSNWLWYIHRSVTTTTDVLILNVSCCVRTVWSMSFSSLVQKTWCQTCIMWCFSVWLCLYLPHGDLFVYCKEQMLFLCALSGNERTFFPSLAFFFFYILKRETMFTWAERGLPDSKRLHIITDLTAISVWNRRICAWWAVYFSSQLQCKY